MKAFKYYDTQAPNWFVFGQHANGNVDVADINGDIICNIPQKDADRLLAERDHTVKIIEMLGNTLLNVDVEAFKRVWYDGVCELPKVSR